MSPSPRLALAGNDPPVRTLAYLVALRGPEAGRKFVLADPVMMVGASPEAEIHLNAAMFDVQPRHASISTGPDGVHVRDESGGAGVFVNDSRVATAVLHHLDLLRLGRMTLRFLSGPGADDAYREEIYRLGTIDPMTGLFNRRSLEEALAREVERARRYSRPVSVLVVEVDHLDRSDAEHGPDGSDFLIRAIADVLRHRARKVDVVARLQGGRFALILPEVPGVGAYAVAETVRELVAEQALMFSGKRISATVTVGVASASGASARGSQLLEDGQRFVASGIALGGDRVMGPEPGDTPA